MRVIEIVGVWHIPFWWRCWTQIENALCKEMPNVELSFERVQALYAPWQKRRIQEYVCKVIQQVDTGGEVLLLGWSLGGIIALKVAAELERTRVLGVVSFFAPHRYLFSVFSRMLGRTADQACDAPFISLSAFPDGFVLWGSTHSKAERNVWIWSDHAFCLKYFAWPARAIARATAEMLCRNRPEL